MKLPDGIYFHGCAWGMSFYIGVYKVLIELYGDNFGSNIWSCKVSKFCSPNNELQNSEKWGWFSRWKSLPKVLYFDILFIFITALNSLISQLFKNKSIINVWS